MELFVYVLLSGLLFGVGSGAIANAKGRSFLGYFLLGLFFSIVGLLIAIGMPSLRTSGDSEGGLASSTTQDQMAGAESLAEGRLAVATPIPDTKEEAIHYVAKSTGLREFPKDEIESMSDAFTIFLADHYAIRRHEVLGKFTFRDKLYSDLDAALRAARDAYVQDAGRLRQIGASDWKQTRLRIDEGRYTPGGEDGVVATQRTVHGRIELRTDGALEVIASNKDREIRSFVSSLKAAEEFLTKQTEVNQTVSSDGHQADPQKKRRTALTFAIPFSAFIVVCLGVWLVVDIQPGFEMPSENENVAVKKVKDYFAGNSPNPSSLQYHKVRVRKRSNRRWDHIDWKELYCIIGEVSGKNSRGENIGDRPFFAVVGFYERANSEMLLNVPLAFPGAATYEVVEALLRKEC